MKNIAIIPARGGSKRIPRKNIIPFCGRPMISWTIEAALESGVFDVVLVSTDDQEIADISVAEGAEVPFLREFHFDDESSVSEAIITTLSQAESYYGYSFNAVTQLMPNCPLRNAENICSALENFVNGSHKFQISAFEFGWMNPWWAARLAYDGKPEWLFPAAKKSRSQDLEKLFCPTGAIWVAEVGSLRSSQSFYGPDHIFYPIPWKAAVDIDDYEDLQFAEAISSLKLSKERVERK